MNQLAFNLPDLWWEIGGVAKPEGTELALESDGAVFPMIGGMRDDSGAGCWFRCIDGCDSCDELEEGWPAIVSELYTEGGEVTVCGENCSLSSLRTRGMLAGKKNSEMDGGLLESTRLHRPIGETSDTKTVVSGIWIPDKALVMSSTYDKITKQFSNNNLAGFSNPAAWKLTVLGQLNFQ